MHRGDEPEHERTATCDQDGEPSHEVVERDVEEDVLWRRQALGEPDEPRDPLLCQQDTEQRARDGEHEVLDDQQPDDASPSGAQRQPDRNLTAA